MVVKGNGSSGAAGPVEAGQDHGKGLCPCCPFAYSADVFQSWVFFVLEDCFGLCSEMWEAVDQNHSALMVC